MPQWSNSKMKSYYAAAIAFEECPCIVKIEGGRISVTYDYDGGVQVYEGLEDGDGRFELKAKEGDGRANLHRFPDGLILDGWWTEVQDEGMWRIRLVE